MLFQLKEFQHIEKQWLKGVGEEAKKKLTFKTSLLFIDDSLLYDKEVNIAKRLEFINKIKKSTEYSHFVTYYSLLENVSLNTLK